MSGVVALVDFAGPPLAADLLERLAAAAGHRGPDGTGSWREGAAGLAHLALHATPESRREKQPLVRGDLVLAADVRLDGRRELAGRLAGSGEFDRDPTDAELILAAYRRWGVECPWYLIGDFAFVLWDGRRRLLFAARDALGVKPLHYGEAGSLLCVASEAQQVVAHPAFPPRLDERTVAGHLANLGDSDGHTFFAGVRQLPPAHRLIADQRGVAVERYWQLDPAVEPDVRSDAEHAERFRELFARAVEDRLRTPGGRVGIALSGGLDSGAIAAMGQRLLSRSDRRLIAASCVFERLSACDERRYTDALAEELGLEIDHLVAERFGPLDDGAVHPPALETPFSGWATTRPLLRGLRARGARVVLTGHGGDHLLQGSAHVYLDALARGRLGVVRQMSRHAREQGISLAHLLASFVLLPLLPEPLADALRRLAGKPPKGGRIPSWIDPGLARRTGLAERAAARPARGRPGVAARREIVAGLAGNEKLRRVIYFYDRTASGFGMEARHPYLDRRLVELVASLPPEQLFRAGCRKIVLRRAMKGLLPEVVRRRHDKTSFGSFVDYGLREREVEPIEALLEEPLLASLGFVNAHRLQEAYSRYRAGGSSQEGHDLLFAITLERWLRAHEERLDLAAARRAA